MNATARNGAAIEFEEIVLTRLLAAPRPLVWTAWTDPAHFSRWFGPPSIAVTGCSIDARRGGIIRFCHEATDGSLRVDVHGVFEEVIEPERLVMLLGFVDGAGNPAAHPLIPDWPLHAQLRTIVTLAESGTKTLLTVRQLVVPADAATSAGVKRERRMAREGWELTLDRLGHMLAEARTAK
jgi:uncharacterized protein YndB with AHSA1/START domain